MKVDFLRKAKWYIVGFILVAIMLSVSLSFSAWDSLSFQAKLENAGSGEYYYKYKLADDRYLSDGSGGQNGLIDVGDIVEFGNYYQELTKDGKIAAKTPIRWIVAHKDNANVLTLLAEKVMAFGSFWGNYYHNGTTWVTEPVYSYYQNYSQSTIRAWLNSDYTLRNDNGTTFNANNSEPRFRGFMSEAFSLKEQEYMVAKNMSGMRGHYKDSKPVERTDSYAAVTDMVWIPSWSEVFGTTMTPKTWGMVPIDGDYNTYDGSPNTQFSYFKDANYDTANPILDGYTTAFASSQYSNYTITGATHSANMQDTTTKNANVWWWLRSPNPSVCYDALTIAIGGTGLKSGTYHSLGGVRPAVCVQL